MEIAIKKIAELESCLTKKIARKVMELVNERSSVKRKPRRVAFHAAKPAFYLNDWETLSVYAFDVNSGELLGQSYCGSYSSILNNNNFAKQQSEGLSAPKGVAMLFVRNGSESWAIDVVSSDLVAALPNAA